MTPTAGPRADRRRDSDSVGGSIAAAAVTVVPACGLRQATTTERLLRVELPLTRAAGVHAGVTGGRPGSRATGNRRQPECRPRRSTT